MEELLKILMLEDLEEDAGLVDRVLKRDNLKFERVRVDTRDEFVEALNQFRPDLILSDHSLPQFNSIEALQICRENFPQAPFILVTGAVSEEFAVNCLKEGADDYVLKTNLSRLPLAIRQALRQRSLENDRRTQEQRLLAQNHELSKINGELDSFVYSVSHNLRAPLSSILGIINLVRLEQNANPPVTGEYIELIERSVMQLDDTIKEILDYSRNARGDVKIEPVDLDKLIRECVKHLYYMQGFSRLKLDIEVLGGPIVQTDAYRLSVALTNLISNSVKYQDTSKPISMIRIIANIGEETLRIVVNDNGIGIDDELLPRVFDMFYRANEKSQGAGLGLYITREVVGKMGGTLDIKSVLNGGTTVTITLPNSKSN